MHGQKRTLTSLAIRYVSGRVARGEITKETAEQYESRLLAFAARTNVPPERVARRHVLRWLEQPGLSPHYRRARLSALRVFFEWCVIERHIERDPTLGIKLTKLPPLLPRSLNSDEAIAVVTDGSTADPRARLMSLFMLQCGLRRGEVSRIQLEDIDMRRRVLKVRGKGGGGGVTRRTHLPDELYAELRLYRATVLGSTGPLFRSLRNPDRGLAPATVYDIVVKAMLVAGVKQRGGDGKVPHGLRHTFAHDLVDRGVGVEVVQEALGHASIRNTQIYIAGSVKNLVTALEGRHYLAAPALVSM